jgi:hypothetical protein
MASTHESIVKQRKITFLSTLYPDYIERFYRLRPGLDHRGFADQKTELARDHFSWGDSLPEALREMGYDTINCLANDRPLQARWAKENGHSWTEGGWMMGIAIAQLSAFEPKILYVNDIFTFKPEHIAEIRSRVPSIRVLICFVGIAVERREMLPDCDLLLTCATWNREKLQAFGFRTELQRHAFQPKILSTLLATHRNTENRDIDASFVGSLIPSFHTRRFDSIRMLCRKTPLKIWTHWIERNWLKLARTGLRSLIRDKQISGGAALQLGIGDSRIARLLAPDFEAFHVVEGSSELVRKHTDPRAGYQLFECLFEEFTPEERYDVLLGNHVLEHVDNPVEILSRVRGWLKPDGKAVFTVPNANSLHRRIGVELGLLSHRQELNAQDLRLGHRRVYTISELENDVTSGGFQIEVDPDLRPLRG